MKIDKDLLKRLYLIDHPSGAEHDMMCFIINYCYKIPNITFSIDSARNLYVIKNTNCLDSYACIVAHMDTVQTFTSNREIVMNDDVITAQYIKNSMQCGLNADDCNGICIALQLLEQLQDLKVLFTTQEEIGGIGASVAADNVEFFNDVRYMLQADRRGKSDLIIHTNGIQSAPTVFVKDVQEVLDKYGYEPATGSFTDIGVIAGVTGISGVNISCGYYNEHTFYECTHLSELENCLNLMYDMIHALDNGNYYYMDIPVKETTSKVSYEDDLLPCKTCSDMDCMNCTKLPY